MRSALIQKLRPQRLPSPRPWLLCWLGAAALAACNMDLDYLSQGGGGTSARAGGSAGTSSEGGGGVFSSGGTFSAAGQLGSGGTAPTGNAGEPPEQGGSTGDAGAPATTTPKYDIVSMDGRVVPESNTFGIDGEWRKFGFDVTAIETRFVGTQVCIRGKIVAGGWGGGLQLVLRDSGVEGAPGLPYDAIANGLAGIRFVIEGPSVPARARIKFKQIGTNDDYCRELSLESGDLVTLRTADALRSCPTPGGGAVNPTQLENFEIHMYPEAAKDLPFDFCVKQVTAMGTAD